MCRGGEGTTFTSQVSLLSVNFGSSDWRILLMGTVADMIMILT